MSDSHKGSEDKMVTCSSNGAEHKEGDSLGLAVVHLTTAACECTNCHGSLINVTDKSKCISVPHCEPEKCQTDFTSHLACNSLSSNSNLQQSDSLFCASPRGLACVVGEVGEVQGLNVSSRKCSHVSKSQYGLENTQDLSSHSSVRSVKFCGYCDNGKVSNAQGFLSSESEKGKTIVTESSSENNDNLLSAVQSVGCNTSSLSGGACQVQKEGPTLDVIDLNSEIEHPCLHVHGCDLENRGTVTNKLSVGDSENVTVTIGKSTENCGPQTSGESCLIQEESSGDFEIEGHCTDHDAQPLLESEMPDDDFFSWLPHEVFLTILSYLSPRELARYVAPVCQRWRKISKDPILWQTLELDNVSSVFMCRVVRDCPLLRRLFIRGRSNFTVPEAMVLTDFCQNLEEIDLGFSQNVDVHRLEPFIEKCPKLRSLNVEGCPQVDGAAVRVLAKATSLQLLNFSHCVKLVDEDVILLVESLPRITQINVDGMAWITDESVTRLVLLHGRHLTHLRLDGEELTDTSLYAIAQCSSLIELSISFCQALSEECLISLKCLTNLKKLCLRKGEDFTSKAFCDAFSGTELSQLTHLNISECTNVDDAAILAIVQCCGKTLREFQLDWCWNISDMGLISIIDHCGSLCVLSLVGVKDLQGHALDRIPEDIPTLTLLDLQQVNMIDDAILVDMVRRKADLKIMNYYGEEIITAQGEEANLLGMGLSTNNREININWRRLNSSEGD